MDNIKVFSGEYEIPFTVNKFSGGEFNIKLGKMPSTVECLFYIVDIDYSDEIMILALLRDALGHATNGDVKHILFLDYLPYARQDRVCSPGEAFSLKVFANILNTMNFTEVVVKDPHSEKTKLFIDNCKALTVTDLLGGVLDFFRNTEDLVLISPDKGAQQKVLDLSLKSGVPMVFAHKTRDPVNHKITGTYLEQPQYVQGKVCLIVDDICDYGGTFVPLAQKLYEAGAKDVLLYITHAILPNGPDALNKAGISYVFYNRTRNPNVHEQYPDKMGPLTIDVLEEFIYG